MTKSLLFLVALSLFADAGVSQAAASLPPPQSLFPSRATPEVLACAMVTFAALVLAWIGLRRSVTTDECARTLRYQLATEREARSRSDQALADNNDVLYRLVRQHEAVREDERARIRSELRALLGPRLLSLRNDMASMQTAPEMAARRDRALGDIDGAIIALRIASGGLRGVDPAHSLRRALERCLAEHARQRGLRYRFEAGVDPGAHAGQDRAARLAVFRALQEVLAGAASAIGEAPERELHVRLHQGVNALRLEIDGCAGTVDDLSALPPELVEHIHGMGGIVRIVAGAGQQPHWSLSLPLAITCPGVTGIEAEVA